MDHPPFRETILIADDDPHIREILHFALKKEGFHTREAENGLHCLDIFRRESPDLLVLDINMPRINGLEFLDAVKNNNAFAEIPVVIVSTEGKEEDTVRGLKMGAKGYVKKPFQASELHSLIEKITGS